MHAALLDFSVVNLSLHVFALFLTFCAESYREPCVLQPVSWASHSSRAIRLRKSFTSREALLNLIVITEIS